MSIGKRLREERERLNLKQDQLHEITGVTRRTQSSYENDQTKPKGEFLQNIATFGFDVGYIITGVRAENVAHTPTEMGYLRHCRLLSTKGLECKGLDGLVFLRESNCIKLEDMPSGYQTLNENTKDDEPIILDLNDID